MKILSSRSGMVLGMSIILAVLFALVAYSNLLLAISQAEQTRFFKSHPTAKYAAEAGIVIARERLMANPNYCGPGGTGTWTQQVDSDGDGFVKAADLNVQITLSAPCPSAKHTISSKVVY